MIGAQAVYLHTGPADLAVAEFTTDADLAIAPEFLADRPDLGNLLEGAGFSPQQNPGMWKTADGVQLDLLVPDALAGPGRRGARLPGHGKRSARPRRESRERSWIPTSATSAPSTPRTTAPRVAVAGPAALFVAKVHKISERVDEPDRLVAKDALDVLRILRASRRSVADGLRGLLDSEIARGVTIEALTLADGLLNDADSPGPQMAARAAGGLEDADVVAGSLAALWSDLATQVGPHDLSRRVG